MSFNVQLLNPSPTVVVENQHPQERNTQGSLDGRTVTVEMPTAYEGDSDKQKQAGIGCCTCATILLIAGAITWGACDKGSGGSSAGQGLFFTGLGMLSCMCLSTVCAIGAAAANRFGYSRT